eukprot:53751_1
MMNCNIHILGGSGNNWHLLWNSKIKMLKKISMNYDGLASGFYFENFEAVGLWKREMLLKFGCERYGDCTDNIWKYDIYKCVWQTLKVKLPFKMHSFSCVVTGDERYVIIFGGVREGDKYIDDIFVLDVNDMSLKRSDVKCPVKGKVKVLLMDYGEEYKLLLSWLIRESVYEKVDDVKCPVKGKVKVLLMDYGEEYKLLLSWLIRESVDEKMECINDVFNMMVRWIVTNDVHLIDSN